MASVTPRTRPDYGIDSPAMVVGYFGLGAVAAALALLWPHLGPRWVAVLWIAGGYFLLSGAGMLNYSRRGKLRIREEMLAAIPWRGDEQVLDVGCGRGLLAIGAARRLVSGRAVGLDLWVRGALSGNSPAAVARNAACEGVADRVETRAGSVLQLPFADGAFDVVLSNFVLHEVNSAAERRQMLAEMMRVLRPGGRLALVDFIFTGEAAARLSTLGAVDVTRRPVGPWVARMVSLLLNFGLVRICEVVARKAPA